MMATAPAASAAMEVCAPASTSVEQITTGVGRSAITFFRKGDAVHAWHFNVEHDHIRPLHLHARNRQNRVGHRGDHFNVGVGASKPPPPAAPRQNHPPP
jgi:hypothetical protein